MEQSRFSSRSCQSASIGPLDDHLAKLVIDPEQFIDPNSAKETGISALTASAAFPEGLRGHLPAIREISRIWPPWHPAVFADSAYESLGEHSFYGA
tara:strand:+ start:159 stop:446 length:288 start_codon:yes stop_codon:yes gene_type:complete